LENGWALPIDGAPNHTGDSPAVLWASGQSYMLNNGCRHHLIVAVKSATTSNIRRGDMFSFLRKNEPALKTKRADHLSLTSVGDPANLGGIVRVGLKVSADAKQGGTLKATAAGVETALGPVEPGQALSIGVHFHLLPNGQQLATFELSEPDGSVSSVEATITVDHAPGLADETARLLREGGTPMFFVGPCDSRMYPYGRHIAWFDRPDAGDHIARLLGRGEINEAEAVQLGKFVEQGFLVLEGLIDDELVDAVNAEIDNAIASGYQGYKHGSSQRIEHLHMHYPNVRKLWLDKRHRRFANLIFGATARPCQTLTYVFGSQQDAHQDLVHLTPFPAGYMCGTWIALQDVVPDSGELVVYPGSHRERRVYLADVDCKKVSNGDWSEFGRTICAEWADMTTRYEPFVYRPKKGTVLIWHENLLHAGSVRKDGSLERRSIVIHSFADGAVAYYDSTGLIGSAAPRWILG
jgi:hypothetical protein